MPRYEVLTGIVLGHAPGEQFASPVTPAIQRRLDAGNLRQVSRPKKAKRPKGATPPISPLKEETSDG